MAALCIAGVEVRSNTLGDVLAFGCYPDSPPDVSGWVFELRWEAREGSRLLLVHSVDASDGLYGTICGAMVCGWIGVWPTRVNGRE